MYRLLVYFYTFFLICAHVHVSTRTVVLLGVKCLNEGFDFDHSGMKNTSAKYVHLFALPRRVQQKLMDDDPLSRSPTFSFSLSFSFSIFQICGHDNIDYSIWKNETRFPRKL